MSVDSYVDAWRREAMRESFGDDRPDLAELELAEQVRAMSLNEFARARDDLGIETSLAAFLGVWQQ